MSFRFTYYCLCTSCPALSALSRAHQAATRPPGAAGHAGPVGHAVPQQGDGQGELALC